MLSRVPQAIPYFISVPRTSRVFVAVIEILGWHAIPLVVVNTWWIGSVPVLPLKTQPIRWKGGCIRWRAIQWVGGTRRVGSIRCVVRVGHCCSSCWSCWCLEGMLWICIHFSMESLSERYSGSWDMSHLWLARRTSWNISRGNPSSASLRGYRFLVAIGGCGGVMRFDEEVGSVRLPSVTDRHYPLLLYRSG